MHKTRFHLFFWTFWTAVFLGIFLIEPPCAVVLAQNPVTSTATPGGPTPYITNVFQGEPAINVRTGPSTIFYPDPCGFLPLGATAPALGSSPAHEWILIEFNGCPNGKGWVYAPNVDLSPGYLPIVEPPPTETPLATSTIDPTLAAAFNIQPTLTRLPTFTPAPPLVVPTFVYQAPTPEFPIGWTIIAIALAGIVVLAVSFLGRH